MHDILNGSLMENALPSVALYFYCLSKKGGGAERMICQLANDLSCRGFSVFLFSFDQPDSSAFYPISPNVNWVRLSGDEGMRAKLRRTLLMASHFKKNNIRVLVGFVMSGDKSVFAAAKLAGVKIVAAERNAPSMYYLKYSFWKRNHDFLLMHLANVITVQLQGYIFQYPKSLKKKIQFIPNPVPATDCNATPSIPGEDGRFYLLGVSRLEFEQKRIDLLVHAFAGIARDFPAWTLRLVGDGSCREQLLSLIRELDLDQRVIIEGASEDVYSYYRKSHLFVIPSAWEGFSNALAEAMSCGLPAVGFAEAQGVSELIGTDAGWLALGLDSVKSFSDAMAMAMLDNEERLKRGEAAKMAMTKFNPACVVDAWVSLLRRSVSEL